MALIFLEAEDYSGFSDRSTGNNGGLYRSDDVDIGRSHRNFAVGWIEAGEWLTYDLVIEESGSYQLSAEVASLFEKNFGFSASIAGQSATANFGSTGGWSDWAPVYPEGLFALEAGTYELRLDMLVGGFNLDILALERVGDLPPPEEGVIPEPQVIEAEDYVNFFDLTAGNTGGDYRDDDVDISGVPGAYGVGWTQAGEWLTYELTVARDGNYQLLSSVASAFDNDFSFQAAIAGQTANFDFGGTGGWQTWQSQLGDGTFALETGTYELRVDLNSGGFNLDFFTLQWLSEPDPEQPVFQPQVVLIEAEDYDGFLDLSPGNTGGAYRNDDVDLSLMNLNYGVGWIQQGEWLTYNLTVPEAGEYALSGYVSSAFDSDFSFAAAIAGQSVAFSFDETGSWSSWKDVTAEGLFSLGAGSYELRLDMQSGGFNLDSLTLTQVSTNGTAEPIDESEPAAGPAQLLVQAEDFDRYFDSTPGNTGGDYRDDGVDISGVPGTYGVGWITPGEWLEYDLVVPETGQYQFNASVAALFEKNYGLNVSIGDQSATLNFDSTGGWAAWQDQPLTGLFDLQAGSYELRLDMLSSDFSLDFFTLTKQPDGQGDDLLQTVRIQAEDYDFAVDRSPGNIGGAYRDDNDVDIGGGGNNFSLGWTEQGEWLTYSVDVAEAGTYQLAGSVASAIASPHGFQVSLANQSSVATFGGTGGWSNNQTVLGDSLFALEEGSYELRLNILRGQFNLDYLELVEVPTPEGGLLSGAVAEVSLDYGEILDGTQTVDATATADTLTYASSARAVQVDLGQNNQKTFADATYSEPIKLLPLGDSITEGVMESDVSGYRDDLWSLLNQGGYSVDFVGNRTKGIGNFDLDHAGIGGERIDQVESRVDGLVSSYQPDAILLMAGTNDINQGAGVALAASRMDSLMDRINAQQPNGQLFVAAIPPLSNASFNQEAQQYNAQVEALVLQKQAQGQSVTFVDLSNQLSIADLEDGIHPTADGNRKLAEAWYEALQGVYAQPFAQVESALPAAVNQLIGSDFDDQLVGNSQDNLIRGGQGYDQLTGGTGADRFVLETGGDTDYITDFVIGEDYLVLSGGLSYGDVDVVSGASFGSSRPNEAILLDAQGQQLALLAGVEASQLDGTSFLVDVA